MAVKTRKYREHNKLDLIGTYLNTTLNNRFKFFLNENGTFIKIYHMMGHKANFNNFQRI